MLLHLLAQTTQAHVAGDKDPVTWYQLAQFFFFPVILVAIGAVLYRLRRGDDKFEVHAKSIHEQAKVQEGIVKTLDEIRNDLKKTDGKTRDIDVEGRGAVGELRVEIERDFLRKHEFREYAHRHDRQHAELMQAIREIEKGKN